MTAQRLFSEKWLDRRLLGNLLRRRTVHILVAFLAVFFSLAVPLMLFGDLGTYEIRLSAEEELARFLDRLSEIFTFYTFAMGVLGVYFGALTMRFMMDRRSAVFYHALPQKRRTLLLTSITGAQISMLAGTFIGICVSMCVIAAHGMLLPAVWLAVWSHLWKNAIFYLIIYAGTVFMGSFSGGTAVQVLLSLVSLGYLPLMILMIFATHDMNASHFYMDYYIGTEFMYWTSPVAWPLRMYVGEYTVWQGLGWVCIALALLVLTFLIYRRRKIENTGKTILFPKVGSLIKYLLMAAAALVGDLFFSLFDEGFSIFGLVCGIFLSFIICNTILEKSPRGMFKGVKGLIVFALATAVFFAVWQADIFRMDDYLPRAERISYAEIQIDGTQMGDVRFEDAETLSALVDLLGAEEEVVYGAPYPMVSIKAVLHQKFGPPLARRYYLSRDAAGMDKFLYVYAAAADLNAPYRDLTARMRMRSTYADPYAEIAICVDDGHHWISDVPLAQLLEIYGRELGNLDAERISEPAVMYFSIASLYSCPKSDGAYEYLPYDRYLFNRDLPIYSDMTATLEFLNGFFKEESENSNVKSLRGIPTSAVVYCTDFAAQNQGDVPYVKLSAEEAAALLPYLCDLDTTPYSLRAFVDIDTDYYVGMSFVDTAAEIEENADTAIPETASRTMFFRGGSVPASVRELFK